MLVHQGVVSSRLHVSVRKSHSYSKFHQFFNDIYVSSVLDLLEYDQVLISHILEWPLISAFLFGRRLICYIATSSREIIEKKCNY